jgi:hypothetical protein
MTTVIDRTLDLLAPPLPPVDDRTRTEVRDRLVATLAPLMEQLPPGDQVVVNPALLRLARSDPQQLAGAEEPFAWKPAFARRSLGLAVVSACASGRFRTPADAVGPVAAEAVDQWKRTGWRTFHWEPWLAGLPTGARAAVLADALTWATALWSSFDWRALPAPAQIGGVDDQWICPAVRTMRLKARAELRVPLTGPHGGGAPGRCPPSGPALVSVSGGCPGDGWPDELGYLALVAGLRSPTRPVPSRVLGLWPDAGFHSSVEVDREVLLGAVDRVVATVTAVVSARRAPSVG